PFWVADARVLIGGIALAVGLAAAGVDSGLRRHWLPYAVMGVVNCAVPFALYGYAALHLPASYLAILNAATPLFASVAAALWLNERFTLRAAVGLAAGVAGVALVSRAGPIAPDGAFALAVGASLAAALCYALAGVWLKRYGGSSPPIAIAAWSQLWAGVALLPFSVPSQVAGPIGTSVVINLLLLGLVCSAAAYLLYFRLIADVGPTRAMTVTFLMPAFGMLWGGLLLHEAITLPMIAGALLIVGGTASVLRRSSKEPPAQRRVPATSYR
ncbi:MAG TPA: DMT family transporter, partial [Casimicrobiaceae bacterium]|nr:DMT family transporter [Casimicrobiaceae bacterium]